MKKQEKHPHKVILLPIGLPLLRYPPVWQKNIADGLHTGEELYFFDIIVFDKQGRRFFAPEIKIAIQ
jgi:hypothetical protein